MSEDEFNSNKDSIEEGIANTVGVNADQVECSISSGNNLRRLLTSLNVDTVITTLTTDVQDIVDVLESPQISSNIETELSNLSVDVVVNDVGAANVGTTT